MLTVAQVCAQRDAAMREVLRASADFHPQRPKWIVDADSIVAEDATEDPQPLIIMYDDKGNAMNEQQEVHAKEEISITVPIPPIGSHDSDIRWKHMMVNALSTAEGYFAQTGPVDNSTMQITKIGNKTTLTSKTDWSIGQLHLVPKVSSIANMKDKPADITGIGGGVQLVRDCGERNLVHVLVPDIVLPRKGDSPDAKYSIVPAWLAKRSGDLDECNMQLKTIPYDEVCTIGVAGKEAAMHYETHNASIPVFVNSKVITNGQEIVIYAKPTKATGVKKKAVRTWKNIEPPTKKEKVG